MDNLRRCFLTESEVKEVAIKLPKTGYNNMIVRKLYLPMPLATDKGTILYFFPCDSTGAHLMNKSASSYANAKYYFRTDGNTYRFGISGASNSRPNMYLLRDSVYLLDGLLLYDVRYNSSGSSRSSGFNLFPVGTSHSGTTADRKFVVTGDITDKWINDCYTIGEPLYMEVDIAPYGIANIDDESIVYDCMKLSTYNAKRTAGDVYYVPV